MLLSAQICGPNGTIMVLFALQKACNICVTILITSGFRSKRPTALEEIDLNWAKATMIRVI